MKFIGVKIIEAQPMTAGEFVVSFRKQASLDAVESPDVPGYCVEYDNGYRSWSPKEVFEKAYFPMGNSDGTKVSQDMVDRFMGAVASSQLDNKTTLVSATMATGFVQHEVSSCVDPQNYDHELGTQIATDRIKDSIWKLLGFVLQWGRCGLK